MNKNKASTGDGKNLPQESFVGGAPTIKEVSRFGDQIESSKQSPYMIIDPVLLYDPKKDQQENQDENRAANAGKYPIRPLPKDPYDTTWAIKDDMTRRQPGYWGEDMVTERRPMPFTEDDIAYLKRKRDAEENAGFLFWQANKYDLNDPATRDWFNRVCPSYFTQRESLVEEQIDLAARYAKIRLRGARNQDDLKLQYFIETDRVSLPKGPLWDPYLWMQGQAEIPLKAPTQVINRGIFNYNENAYRKGLFNPTRVTTPETGGLIPNRFNRGDIAGYPNSNYTGVMGASVSTSANYATAYQSGADGQLAGARFRDNKIHPYNSNVIKQNTERQIDASLVANGRGFSREYTTPKPYPKRFTPGQF